MKARIIFFLVLVVSIVYSVEAQYTPFYQWTILPEEQMDEIIGEISGETALNHAIEMVGYQRNRPAREYGEGEFREGKYVLGKLNDYGIPLKELERFKGGTTWDGIKGELWEVSPRRKKLADYDDIALSLAKGSQPADLTAELIWVGEGKEIDLKGLNVEGKVIVTSGKLNDVLFQAVERGAVGAVAFGSGRDLKTPTAIPSSGLKDETKTFGFYLTPRDGHKLRDRLKNGEKITVHAVVESEILDYDLQVTSCYIPGTDPEAGDIILSAHIYEGYTKQGANDNVSGSAVILETARALNQLYEEGRIPRPKRGIRFIWVPEYSGTIPWVEKHRDLMQNTLCNINLDMVGINLKESNSFFSLMRTTYGNPHYVNDVMENYFVYMGEVNREILSNRKGEKIINEIIAPSGSDDAFYYQIEQHYGASDHEVFNHWTTHVPGVMLITWPDLYYHTSEDIPNKLDATQMKRAAVIAASGAYTIASADEEMAMNIANTAFTYAARRSGIEMARALDEIAKSEAQNFSKKAVKAGRTLEAFTENEIKTILSVQELAPESDKLKARLEFLASSIEQSAETNQRLLEDQIKFKAENLGQIVPGDELSAKEREADKIVPAVTEKLRNGNFKAEDSVKSLSDEVLEKYPYEEVASTKELCALINGANSILDIKNKLDAQYRSESDLQNIINYLELLKMEGLVTF